MLNLNKPQLLHVRHFCVIFILLPKITFRFGGGWRRFEATLGGAYRSLEEVGWAMRTIYWRRRSLEEVREGKRGDGNRPIIAMPQSGSLSQLRLNIFELLHSKDPSEGKLLAYWLCILDIWKALRIGAYRERRKEMRRKRVMMLNIGQDLEQHVGSQLYGQLADRRPILFQHRTFSHRPGRPRQLAMCT